MTLELNIIMARRAFGITSTLILIGPLASFKLPEAFGVDGCLASSDDEHVAILTRSLLNVNKPLTPRSEHVSR